ncbi:hypothetical protein JCM12178A_23630 [Salidesulfovibrio brasiliensis]
MAFFHLQGIEFKIYYWTETSKAGAMVEAVSPSPAALMDLSQRLRALNMTSVEYAIDFMCKTAVDVLLVHWLLRRYSHFPGYTGAVNSAGRVFTGIDDEGDENSVSYFWNNSRREPNAVKIYERGPDALKRVKDNGQPFWRMEDLDRVRLEFVVSNGKLAARRKRLGVKFLQGFRNCPRMSDVLEGTFRFCVFQKSSQLPQEWDHYPELDGGRGIESFHVEWLAAVRKLKNAHQCHRDSALMAPLMRKIRSELVRYDERWAKQAEKALGLKLIPAGRVNPWTVIR